MKLLEKEEAYKVIETIEEEFKKYNLFCDVYNDYSGINIEISWGDWKHDHWCAKEVAGEVLTRLGYKNYNITSCITEENGSDCYSAVHTIRFY